MATESVWTFNGGKTTVIQGLAPTNTEWMQWQSCVIKFIAQIAETSDFAIEDNGYRRFPGVLVTSGVKGYFRGEPFEIWSDVQGELILRHDTLGFRLASELIRNLEALWKRE